MTYTLTKSFPRLWSLDSGKAMVVTDLHGDWDAYRRYRDRFKTLRANRLADCLIFTGDLIHTEEDPDVDQSLEIVRDVILLQEEYGDAIIYLCGNHEMPHIYGTSLARGNQVYTPNFEKAMTAHRCRDKIIPLFNSLPFYLRTHAGVSLTHAGAPAIIAGPQSAARLFNWDHQYLLNWADTLLQDDDIEVLRRGYELQHQNIPYQQLAAYFLAVSGPDDPRYNDLLRASLAGSHPTYDKYLWPALFTRNEKDYGLTDFRIFLDALLQELSVAYVPQHVLVAGHITIMRGHQIITKQHLRLASAHHARPREAGQYLLFDTARPVKSAQDLVSGLGTVF